MVILVDPLFEVFAAAPSAVMAAPLHAFVVDFDAQTRVAFFAPLVGASWARQLAVTAARVFDLDAMPIEELVRGAGLACHQTAPMG